MDSLTIDYLKAYVTNNVTVSYSGRRASPRYQYRPATPRTIIETGNLFQLEQRHALSTNSLVKAVCLVFRW